MPSSLHGKLCKFVAVLEYAPDPLPPKKTTRTPSYIISASLHFCFTSQKPVAARIIKRHLRQTPLARAPGFVVVRELEQRDLDAGLRRFAPRPELNPFRANLCWYLCWYMNEILISKIEQNQASDRRFDSAPAQITFILSLPRMYRHSYARLDC